MYLVAQSIVGGKTAEPAFVVDVEIGEVGELQRAVEQLLRYVERRQRAVGLLRDNVFVPEDMLRRALRDRKSVV